MTKSLIMAAYNRGLTARNQIVESQGPQRCAAYKLREVARRVGDYIALLERYGEGARANDIPYILGPCAGYEAEQYFRGIPEWVAFDLGHDIVPLLDCLIGDGVQAPVIEDVKRIIGDRLPYIAECGDHASTELKNEWKTVHRYLGGRSTADEYLDACLQLLHEIIEMVSR